MQAQGSPQAQASHYLQAQEQQQPYYSDSNPDYAQTSQQDPRYSRRSPVQIYTDETPRAHKRRAVEVEEFVLLLLFIEIVTTDQSFSVHPEPTTSGIMLQPPFLKDQLSHHKDLNNSESIPTTN